MIARFLPVLTLLVFGQVFAAQEVINIGTAPNDHTGDTARIAFGKINDNFTEVYSSPFLSPISAYSSLCNNTVSAALPSSCTSLTFGAASGLHFVSSGGFVTSGLYTSGNNLILAGNGAGGSVANIFSIPLDNSTSVLTFNRLLQATASQTISTTVTPYFRVSLNPSGTVTSGQAFYSMISINSDSLNTTGAGGPGGAHGLYVGQNISNALMTGHRTGITGFESITGATGNVGAGVLAFYTGTAGDCLATSPDGGTAPAPAGGCFGLFGSAWIKNGATNWKSVVGQELDISIDTGGSAAYETGLQIVHRDTHAVKGSNESTALTFSDQIGASIGWDRLIGIGSTHGQFSVTGGTIMGAVPTTLGGPAYSVAHGIDFVNNGGLTCTVDCFASTGFSVDGSGNVSVASVAIGGKLLIPSTAPTVISGFGTSPSISHNRGPSSFSVLVSATGASSSGVVGLPTTDNGWACSAADVTTPAANMTQQTGSGASSATFTNYVRTTGVAGNWPASDVIQISCMPN